MKYERPDALLVIKFLGVFSILGLAITGTLLALHIETAAVAILSALVGSAVGNLGGMLSSTKPVPPVADAQPVTITNSPSNPVNVTETPPADTDPPAQDVPTTNAVP